MSNSSSKFYVGQEGIKTRDGRDARIICIDANEHQPIVAVVDGRWANTYTKTGHYHSDDQESKQDLILPKRTVTHTIYANVYKNRITVHEHEDVARDLALCTCLAVAVPVTVNVEV